jgi:hypothetical protein
MNSTKDTFNLYKNLCEEHDLYVYTYAPGDGVTRYKFSRDANSNYFACHTINVQLGRKDAIIYMVGFMDGKY